MLALERNKKCERKKYKGGLKERILIGEYVLTYGISFEVGGEGIRNQKD